MLFSSIPFLYYFLPIVLIVYFLVPRVLKNSVLLLASLIFYAWGEPKYVLLMIATIALFYVCGLGIGKSRTQKGKKIWLTVSAHVLGYLFSSGHGLLASSSSPHHFKFTSVVHVNLCSSGFFKLRIRSGVEIPS